MNFPPSTLGENGYLSTGEHLYKVIIIVYFLWVTFPGSFGPIQPGLDASWMYGLNYLAQSNHRFGRDVAFTYGPLGYLLVPLNIGPNLVHATVLRIVMHILFGLLMTYYLWRGVVQFLLFTAVYLIAYSNSWYYDYQLLLTYILLICVSLETNKFRFITAIAGGTLAGILLAIKFNLGLSSLVTGMVFTATILLKEGRREWRVVSFLWLAYLLAVIFLLRMYFGSFDNFASWLKASLAIADGYSIAMSLMGARKALFLGLYVLLVYTILLVALWISRLQLRYAATTIAAILFFVFKHGFTRHDPGHIYIFFDFCIAVFGVILLNARRGKELALSLVGALAVLGAVLPFEWKHGHLIYTPIVYTVSGERGWTNIRPLFTFDETRRDLDRQSAINLESRRLPNEWLNTVSEVNGTVDVLPSEISYCPANNLSWNPNPVLQTYSAYTSFLDQWSADHYVRAGSPDFILVEFTDIDGRNPLLSTPATWRAIMQNYEVIHSDKTVSLLKRKSQFSVLATEALRQENVEAGQWVEVPNSDDLLFAEISMRLPLFGKVVKTLYQIPPVYLDLLYDDGQIMTYRIIPDTAKNGLLINYVPTSLKDLEALLTGSSDKKVVKFRVHNSGGSYYYDRKIDLVWKKAPAYKVILQKNVKDPGNM